ncbi:MAG: hypothetical protein L7W43_10720 [Rubripirellula sp.]|nr:hypothetical protein [Rubripirellula sp.]
MMVLLLCAAVPTLSWEINMLQEARFLDDSGAGSTWGGKASRGYKG